MANTNGRLFINGDLTVTRSVSGGEIHANSAVLPGLPPTEVTTADLTLTKVTDTAVLVDTTFPVELDCDGTAFDSSEDIVVKQGDTTASVTVADVPDGTHCSASEPNAPTGWGLKEISPSNFVLDASGDNTITVTNERQLGSLKLTKVVDTADPATAHAFTITLDCGGGTPADGDHVLTVAANGTTVSQTISGIPVGTTCSATEPSPPDGFGSSPTISGPVTIGPTTQATVEITVSNTRLLGHIDIAKTGSGAAPPAAGATFTARINCPGTAWDQDVTLTLPNTSSVRSGAIPVGMSCTVTEPANKLPSGWQENGFTPSGTVVVDDDAGVDTTVDNLHNVGQVRVTKALGAAPGSATTFTIRLDCGTIGKVDVPVTVTPPATSGSALTGELSSGTHCTYDSEPSLSDEFKFVSASPTAGVTVTAGNTVDLTVTNTAVQFSSFEIVKNLTGPLVDGGAPAFDFTVDCDDDDYDTTASVTVPAGQRSARATVAKIPVGTSCTVSEEFPADIDSAVWLPDTSTPTVVLGTDQSASFTNSRIIGALKIDKTITGDTPPGPVDFTFRLDCTGTDFDGDHTVTVTPPATTEPVIVSGVLPAGLNCDISELTPPQGWTNTSPPAPASFTVRNMFTAVVTVTAENDYATGSVRVIKNTMVEGNPAPVAVDTAFPMELDCGVFTASPVVTVPTGASAASVVVPDIPAGATCVVSEPAETIPFGWRLGSVSPAAVTVGDGTTVDVTVENEKILFGGPRVLGVGVHAAHRVDQGVRPAPGLRGSRCRRATRDRDGDQRVRHG